MIYQGDIYLTDLNPVKGHEQGGARPVLVIQNNILNKNLSTVIIFPLTTNLKAKDHLTTYFLDRKSTHLSFDSVVLIHQIRTIDQTRLKRKISSITPETLRKLKQQMVLVF
ncbi:MAG: type II toxin-antitoxin system PemK/MazF family toxin [Candidatus Gracilibacteria bacterium]